METRADLACPCCSEPLRGEDAIRIAAIDVATSPWEGSQPSNSVYPEQLACGHKISVHFDSDGPRRLECADVQWLQSAGGGTVA